MNKNNIYIPSVDSETEKEIKKEPGHLTFLKIAKYALIVCIALFLTMLLYRAFQTNKEKFLSIIFIPASSTTSTLSSTSPPVLPSVPSVPSTASIRKAVPNTFTNEFENSALNMLKKLN